MSPKKGCFKEYMSHLITMGTATHLLWFDADDDGLVSFLVFLFEKPQKT